MAEWRFVGALDPVSVSTDVVVTVAGADPSRAAALTDRLAGSRGARRLVDLIDLVVAGRSITAAPAFLLGVREDASWRLAVRGPIEVLDGRGTVLVGEGLETWREGIVPDARTFTVRLREGADYAADLVPRAAAEPQPEPSGDVTLVTVPDWESTQSDDDLATATVGGESIDAPDPSPYDDLFAEHTVARGVAAAAAAAVTADTPPDEAESEVTADFDSSDAAVSAVLCRHQHPNPPHRTECWKCREQIDLGELVTVARPSLGTLRLPDGRTVPIDRTVVIGRNPRVDRADASDLPTVIALGPDAAGVSRTHARVILDGWQVLVEDVGSTFGSTLIGADGVTRRLRPGQPELVNGDSVLDLGGGSRVRLMGVP